MKKNHIGIITGFLLLSGLTAMSANAAIDSLTINNSCRDTSISVEQILPNSEKGPRPSVDPCQLWTGNSCKTPTTANYGCDSNNCSFNLTNKYGTRSFGVKKSQKIQVNFKDENGACTTNLH